MEIPGLNKIADALGNAFSVFDFSFFISGAVTLGFILIDMHYYGYNAIFHLRGWIGGLVYILAIYICGLMSWSIGKLIRWAVLRLMWGKDGINADFEKVFKEAQDANRCDKKDSGSGEKEDDTHKSIFYTKMWIEIEKDSKLIGKLSSLNRMWVMVAVFEGLSFSWLVGLFVYLDGWLVGKWIETESVVFNFVPLMVLLLLFAVSLHRATIYSRDLVKEVVTTYYNK